MKIAVIGAYVIVATLRIATIQTVSTDAVWPRAGGPTDPSRIRLTLTRGTVAAGTRGFPRVSVGQSPLGCGRTSDDDQHVT